MRKRDMKQYAMVPGAAAWALVLCVLIAAAGILLSCSIESPYTAVISNKIKEDGYVGARGILDTSFGGGDGVVNHHGAGDWSDGGVSVVSLDQSGNILVCGYSHNGNNIDMIIWRCHEDGSLDESFGSAGIVTHDSAAGGSGNDEGNSICVDGSGRILVCGTSYNGSDDVLALWRYLEDGTQDPDFGSGGFLTYHGAAGGNGSDCGQSLYLDTEGRIIVCGYSYNGSDIDMVLWRYDDEGNLDTNFGNSGVVIHDGAAGGDDWGSSVCIDGHGRILVCGYTYNGSDSDMALWRFLENGTPDPDFGSGGVVTHHNAAGGNGYDWGHSVCTDSSGRIVVCGQSDSYADADMAVWRFLEDGTPDPDFGSNGFVIHHGAAGGNGADRGYSVCIDEKERILVCGSSYGEDRDMAIWRFTPDGSLDQSFGNDGVVTHHGAAGGDFQDRGYALTLVEGGKILVCGESDASGGPDMALWRYK